MVDSLFEDKRPDIRLIMTEEAMVIYNYALEKLKNPLEMDGLAVSKTALEQELKSMEEALQHRVEELRALAGQANRQLLEEVVKRREGVKLVRDMIARITKVQQGIIHLLTSKIS